MVIETRLLRRLCLKLLLGSLRREPFDRSGSAVIILYPSAGPKCRQRKCACPKKPNESSSTPFVTLSFLSYPFAVSSLVRVPKKRTKKVKPAAPAVKHTIRKPFTCPTQVMSDDSDSDVKIIKTVKTDVPSKKRTMYVIDPRRFFTQYLTMVSLALLMTFPKVMKVRVAQRQIPTSLCMSVSVPCDSIPLSVSAARPSRRHCYLHSFRLQRKQTRNPLCMSRYLICRPVLISAIVRSRLTLPTQRLKAIAR